MEKGKKTDKSGFIVEGEFKDDKLHGKGTMTDQYGLIRVEGEFKAGKLHGKGKIIDEYGLVIAEGEFIDGKLLGKGTMPINME